MRSRKKWSKVVFHEGGLMRPSDNFGGKSTFQLNLFDSWIMLEANINMWHKTHQIWWWHSYLWICIKTILKKYQNVYTGYWIIICWHLSPSRLLVIHKYMDPLLFAAVIYIKMFSSLPLLFPLWWLYLISGNTKGRIIVE